MNEDDPSQHKKLSILLIGLIAIVLLTASVDFAESGKTTKKDNKIVKQPEKLKEIKFKKTKVSPKRVLMNSTDIYVIGVYPTRNAKKYGYKRYNVHVKNKAHGKWGVLAFEIGKYSGKAYTSPEGLLFIKKRGMKCYDEDYSIVAGTDHGNRNHKIKIVKRSKYRSGDEYRYKKIFKLK